MSTQHQFKVYGGDLNIIKEELKKLKSSGKIHSFHYDGLVESAYFGEITNMPTMDESLRRIKNGEGIPSILISLDQKLL